MQRLTKVLGWRQRCQRRAAFNRSELVQSAVLCRLARHRAHHVLLDKVHHHFGLRSRSAWAKKAAPLRSISIVHLSLRISRFSSFVRCDWLVVIPGCTPVSIFIFFTHERKVSWVQPILDATDCMAAQRNEWSCSPGKTNRTTRSRTSFKYPGHLFIS